MKRVYRSIVAIILILIWLCGTAPATGRVSVTREMRFSTTVGPRSGGTFTNTTVTSNTWSNVSNAAASDNVYTTNALPAFSSSDFLDATNFGFTIPSGSVINGLLLETERKASATGITNNSIILAPNGIDNKAATNNSVSTSESYVSFGSSSDLWGGTWTAADINGASFGASMLFTNGNGSVTTISIDHIRITVTYSPASGGGFFRLIGLISDPYDRPRSVRFLGEK